MLLVSIPVCSLFLSIPVVSGPYLKWFNHYLLIPCFKVPTIRHIWQLIPCCDFAVFIDLEDFYFHIPIVKDRHHFL